jgi:hypothetical protein
LATLKTTPHQESKHAKRVFGNMIAVVWQYDCGCLTIAVAFQIVLMINTKNILLIKK